MILKRGALTLALAVLIAVSPLAAAETILMEESWALYVEGSDHCTLNINTPWVCNGSLGVLEFRGVIADCMDDIINNCLMISDGRSSPGGENTQPRLYRSFDLPTQDYKAEVEYSNIRSHTEDWAIMRLTDTNGSLILQLGFKDNDNYLDITNGSAVDNWQETTYQVPNGTGFRKYIVTVDVLSEKYDLVVLDGASQDYSQNDIPIVASSTDSKAKYFTFGSFDVDNRNVGTWDKNKVYIP